jgi:hypothetical protein
MDTDGDVMLSEELSDVPRALEASDEAAYVVYGAASIFDTKKHGTVETFLIANHGVAEATLTARAT